MRIRQRKVRLPLSSLSPIPLTDPLFTSSPVVQLHPTNDDEEDNSCVRNNPSPTLLLSDNKTGQQQQRQPDPDPNPPIGTGGVGAARTRRENRQVGWREGEGKGGDDGEGNDDDDDTSSR